jgi:aminoglycoside phosphotransferase (APT) family kinase protein
MSDRSGGPHDTVAMRPGEVLDAASLAAWLHTAAPQLLGTGTEALHLTQFTSGFSNLTYRVDGAAQPLVLRRPPRGVGAGPAHDVLREYRVLCALHAAGLQVPEPLAACDDVTVLGAPFYLMQFVDGVILRHAPPDGARFDATVAARLAQTFVHELVTLHALDVDAIGLANLGRGAGYVDRQVRGWTSRWEQARTRDVPRLDAIAAWLAANRPEDAGVSLLHNDFKLDNLVLDRTDLTRVRAILDWEMATVGCPLLDLGTTLAYWIEADDPPLLRSLGLGITTCPGMPSRGELVARYAERSGREVTHAVFLYVYGVFKLAIVAQQLVARFERGLTSDPRFARLGEAVELLSQVAASAIESGRIGRR